MLKAYYKLAKPRIIYANSISALAGFFLAAHGMISIGLLIAMLIGLGLVMGGSCVFNNYIDRGIDAKMERTKHRPTVTGALPLRSILIYASSLLIAGLLTLLWFTNILTFFIGLAGALVYVGLYTPLKPRSVHTPLIGSIAGAVPPLVGFCAVANTINLEAVLLFLIFVIWQMPHFYAIAMYKHADYGAAGIPVLPLERGMRKTKIHIVLYILVFIIINILFFTLGFVGYVNVCIMLVINLLWLWLGIRGFIGPVDDVAWAKRMFLYSLFVITAFSFLLIVTSGF